MRFLDRWFPILFTAPFLLATIDFGPAKVVGEAGRWVILILATTAAAILGFQMGRGRTGGWAGADTVVVGFLAFFALSATWAIDPLYSIQRSLSMGLLYLATFWYFWNWADRHSDDRLLGCFLWTSGVVLGINLLLGAFFAPASLLASRFQGAFDNPNNIGMIVALAVPLSFARMLKSQQWKDRGLWVIFVLNALACGSRTALVCCVVCMTLIISLLAIRNMKIAIVTGATLAAGLLVLSQTDFFSTRILRGDSVETMSNRTLFWDLAKEQYIPKRPVAGHGFGCDVIIHENYGIILADLKLRGYGVMSSYYGLAVAVGIPATVLFFTALWLGTVFLLFKYHFDITLVGYGATVISGLMVSITETAIYSAGNCFSYLFWIAFMLIIRRARYRKSKVPLTRHGELSQKSAKSRGRRKPGVPRQRLEEVIPAEHGL